MNNCEVCKKKIKRKYHVWMPDLVFVCLDCYKLDKKANDEWIGDKTEMAYYSPKIRGDR